MAVGLPTTILGDAPDRLADVAIALAAAPALLVAGSEDRLLDLALLARWSATIPGVSLHVLDGAGHVPDGKQRAEVSRIVTRFLQRE